MADDQQLVDTLDQLVEQGWSIIFRPHPLEYPDPGVVMELSGGPSKPIRHDLRFEGSMASEALDKAFSATVAAERDGRSA